MASTKSTKQWKSDRTVNDCASCKSGFTLFNRRHHCRNCGDIFCDECSKARVCLTRDHHQVRVCYPCLEAVFPEPIGSDKPESPWHGCCLRLVLGDFALTPKFDTPYLIHHISESDALHMALHRLPHLNSGQDRAMELGSSRTSSRFNPAGLLGFTSIKLGDLTKNTTLVDLHDFQETSEFFVSPPSLGPVDAPPIAIRMKVHKLAQKQPTASAQVGKPQEAPKADKPLETPVVKQQFGNVSQVDQAAIKALFMERVLPAGLPSLFLFLVINLVADSDMLSRAQLFALTILCTAGLTWSVIHFRFTENKITSRKTIGVGASQQQPTPSDLCAVEFTLLSQVPQHLAEDMRLRWQRKKARAQAQQTPTTEGAQAQEEAGATTTDTSEKVEKVVTTYRELEGSDKESSEKRYAYIKRSVYDHPDLGNSVEILWRYAMACLDFGDTFPEKTSDQQKVIMEGHGIIQKCIQLDSPEPCFEVCQTASFVLGKASMYISSPQERVSNGKAIRDFCLRCIELRPDDAWSYHVLGRWCVNVVEVNWVVKRLAKALYGDAMPETTYKEAIHNFEQAHRYMPEQIRNLYMLGYCHYKLGKKDIAKKNLDLALTKPLTSEVDKRFFEMTKKLHAKM